MSTIINSPGVVTSVGNSQLFFGIPLPTSCSLRLRVPMEIPLPVEVRIVTTLDHPLPGDALWLFLDGEAAQGFAFLGYTAADYPGKIVLRFLKAESGCPCVLPVTLMDTMRSTPHCSIQWRSSSGSLRQSPLVYVAGNIS